MPQFLRLADHCSRILGQFGSWLIVILTATMVYEVVARHVFDSPTLWAYEVGYMLSGAVFMFGIAYCLLVNGHIRVDFLYNRLGTRNRAVIDIATYALFLLPISTWLT